MTSKEWKKCKLGDICIITMGQSPKSEFYNSKGEGLPFLQGNRTFGFMYPNFDTYTTQITRTAEPTDVIMSVRAPVGDLNIALNKICIGRGICSIRIKNEQQKFLYYLMKHHVSYLINQENGTVFGSVNKNDISNLEVLLPPLETQEKIARVLSSLDDKIELNNKINKNLEQQAQAIFKSWFVNFEPFGGKMPDDWRIGKLEELTQIKSGKRPQLKQADKDDNFSIPIIGASTIMGYTNAILYNEPILITGRVGTHGIINKYNKQCWPSDNTLVIKSKYYEYIYQQLKRIDFAGLNRGSTQPLITQKDLLDIDVVIPTSQKAKEYEQFATQLSIYQDNLITEKEKLTQLRDTLLPKLMNGEIDVDKVEV